MSMKTQSKHLFFRERGLELVRICNEKMACAARDLAEFTKNGINAGFIVALAYKCEDLAQELENEKKSNKALTVDGQMAAEVWQSVNQLCDTGRKIFQNQPSKYKDYVIPVTEQNGSPFSKAG